VGIAFAAGFLFSQWDVSEVIGMVEQTTPAGPRPAGEAAGAAAQEHSLKWMELGQQAGATAGTSASCSSPAQVASGLMLAGLVAVGLALLSWRSIAWLGFVKCCLS